MQVSPFLTMRSMFPPPYPWGGLTDIVGEPSVRRTEIRRTDKVGEPNRRRRNNITVIRRIDVFTKFTIPSEVKNSQCLKDYIYQLKYKSLQISRTSPMLWKLIWNNCILALIHPTWVTSQIVLIFPKGKKLIIFIKFSKKVFVQILLML